MNLIITPKTSLFKLLKCPTVVCSSQATPKDEKCSFFSRSSLLRRSTPLNSIKTQNLQKRLPLTENLKRKNINNNNYEIKPTNYNRQKSTYDNVIS